MHRQEFKDFRAKFSLSQQELAQIFGVTAKSVSNIETGFRQPGRGILQVMTLLDSMPPKQSRGLIKKLIAQSCDGKADT